MGVSEESKKKPEIKEAGNKGLVSLAGLAVVGLALHFGLPYIRDILQSATNKTPVVTNNVAGSQSVEDTSVEKKEIVEIRKEVSSEKLPEALATSELSLSTMSQSAIEEAVDGSIMAALRPSFKSTYTINSVDVSKIANLVSVDLSIDQVSYEVIYSFDENFGRYQAKLEPEFKFFSRSPVFKISQ